MSFLIDFLVYNGVKQGGVLSLVCIVKAADAAYDSKSALMHRSCPSVRPSLCPSACRQNAHKNAIFSKLAV